MLRYILSFLAIWSLAAVHAQVNEIGLTGGATYYIGDLNPTKHYPRDTKLAGGLVFRHNFNDRYALRFTVEDTGIGITPEQQAKLFRSFSQGDTSTTRRFGGTGLGLSIARRLMDLMGGEIVATSVPSRGTVFELHIPAELSEEASCDSVLALRRALG